jgi:hypothetical protein
MNFLLVANRRISKMTTYVHGHHITMFIVYIYMCAYIFTNNVCIYYTPIQILYYDGNKIIRKNAYYYGASIYNSSRSSYRLKNVQNNNNNNKIRLISTRRQLYVVPKSIKINRGYKMPEYDLKRKS